MRLASVSSVTPGSASRPWLPPPVLASLLCPICLVCLVVAARPATAESTAVLSPPPAPFSDFRSEAPGVSHRILPEDLPAPYATQSASNSPTVVARPKGAWPKAPRGFRVGLYAEDLEQPRALRVAPNGDVLVAESGAGRIRLLRGMNADGTAHEMHTFALGLDLPYGMAFYPPGPEPAWLYVGNSKEVVRFAYHNGDLAPAGRAEHIAVLPGGGHVTRDLRFSADGKILFVGVGSRSNVDDPDTTPAEHERANILAMDPDGSHRRVYASGIRNPAGLAIDPLTGTLWCSVNERDGLGDNLAPDYITSVREGGFYGWPWWYIGTHQDPRHAGKHPELRERAIVPDVLLQPHNASLQLLFYQPASTGHAGFPADYDNDVLAAEHGSWNKAVRTGYEVIRIPRHHSAGTAGAYEDFLTGFVLPNGDVRGRPVGVAEMPDGSLLVSDDAGDVIWRVDYAGP